MESDALSPAAVDIKMLARPAKQLNYQDIKYLVHVPFL